MHQLRRFPLKLKATYHFNRLNDWTKYNVYKKKKGYLKKKKKIFVKKIKYVKIKYLYVYCVLYPHLWEIKIIYKSVFGICGLLLDTAT